MGIGPSLPLPLVPHDEDRPIFGIGPRVQNRWEVVSQPRVPRGDTAIVHVVAGVGGDEVVTGHRAILEVRREFGVGRLCAMK